jgi:hypothetical protein
MQKYFTTSRGVHIGRLYVNRTNLRPLDDPDMLLLQDALVRTSAVKMNYKSTRYMQRASIISGILLVCILIVAMFLDARYPI